MTTMMEQPTKMEEAPASPRSAAIYYWGGDWAEEDTYRGDDDGVNEAEAEANNSKVEDSRWEGNDANYTSLYETTFQKRASFQLRRRTSAVKFHLTLRDEGDDDHWMYAPPPLSLSFPDLSLEKPAEEKEEIGATIQEPATVEKNDFADPNIEGDDFNAIPVIDLSQPKHIYAQQIGDACRNVGFFYIINHGVEQSAMDGVMGKSKQFFELDLESKMKTNNPRDGDKESKGYRGYFEIGGEDLENKDGTRDLVAEEGSKQNQKKTKGDFKEGFDCGLERSTDENNACIKFFGENMWPDEKENSTVVGFRKAMIKYQEELLGLSDKLLIALGKSLNNNPNDGDDIAEDYFISRTRNPMCTLRLLHYPPAKGDGSSTSQGCGAHTDYGLFTILQQDSIGGLQVRNRRKQWVDAKPLEGSFVINVGDMLSHWTNGEYASTVHRVVSPSVTGASATGDRYSVPFFFNPDHDAVVKPLGGIDEDGSENSSDDVVNRMVGKTAIEILQARYDGTFQKSK